MAAPLALASGFLLTILLVGNSPGFSQTDSDLIKASTRFFLDNLSHPVATDKVILSYWISDAVQSPELRSYAAKGRAILLNKPDTFNPNLLRLATPMTQPRRPLCGKASTESDMDCLMASAAWCDVIPIGEGFIPVVRSWIARARTESHVDNLSHLLLVLNELKTRSCIEPAKLAPLLTETTGPLAEFMETQVEGYGEGVAMLLRTGFKSVVRPEWVERVRISLRKKIDSRCADCAGNPHDLLLETYAIALWRQ